MEIEKPKVIDNSANNDPNKGQQVASLVHTVFKQNPAGVALLKVLKDFYISDKATSIIFPINPAVLEKFGNSTEIYSGFRSGQAAVIFFLEQMIEQHEQQELVKNQSKEKE